ncbi:hypothetical protein [Paraburkholderia sp. MM6662-R1]|uniref:hypothetical protein n=1 Tax=Paraburkholderia sp. MM6662-R1 TaxID=2991066 RepID=UPI003D20FEA3
MTPLFIKSLARREQAATPTVKVTKDADDSEAPDTGKFAGLLAMLAAHNPESKFGPHNVEKGHTVAFKAGSFVGAGKVAATGRDGLTVQDDDARDHRVHWHEVTGHVDTKKGRKKGKDRDDDAA